MSAQRVGRIAVEDHGAVGDGVTDDSVAIQKAFDALPSRGGVIEFGPKTYRAKNIAPSIQKSYTVEGAGMTATIIRRPARDAIGPIFDLAGSDGPAKIFHGLKLEGGNVGAFQSTGFRLLRTNGLILDHVWQAGLRIGVDWNAPSSFLEASGCVFEKCGQAFLFRGDPIEVILRSTTYFSNVQDLQVTGDCASLLHTASTSIGCTTVAVSLLSARRFRMSDFVINSAKLAFQLTKSNDASLADGLCTANAADFATSGTTRLYAHNVQADFAPLSGPGIYVGEIVGEKRLMTTRGIPTSLSWDAGDRAVERKPMVGRPKAWTRLTSGPGHVEGKDWRSEGDL